MRKNFLSKNDFIILSVFHIAFIVLLGLVWKNFSPSFAIENSSGFILACLTIVTLAWMLAIPVWFLAQRKFLPNNTTTDSLTPLKNDQKGITEKINFLNMLDNLPVLFHLQADDYSIPYANKMFKERFGSTQSGLCYELMHCRNSPCEVCTTFKVFDKPQTLSSLWQAPDGRHYMTVVTPFQDVDRQNYVMEMAVGYHRAEKRGEGTATVK